MQLGVFHRHSGKTRIEGWNSLPERAVKVTLNTPAEHLCCHILVGNRVLQSNIVSFVLYH